MAQPDPRLTFFPKRKVRAYLKGWVPKMNNEGEKRIRLDLEIPMLDEAREGMIPGWVINSLNAMEAPESKESDSGFDTVIEGMTLEFFETPKAPGRSLLLTATTLDGFSLKRIKRDGNTFIALCFNTNVKRSEALKWADKFEACNLWLEATPSAPDMPTKPVPGEQMTIADAEKSSTEPVVQVDSAAQQVAESQANVSEFFHVEPKGEGEDEESEPDGFGVEGMDEEEDETSGNAADPIPMQSVEAAAAVEEIETEPTPITSARPRRPRGFGGPTNKSVN
jgi:hypothetical protein